MSEAVFKNSIKTLLDVCVGIQPDEDVVVVADTNTEAITKKITVAVKDGGAVTPQSEFTPFFDLQYERLSHYTLHWRPRGDLDPRSPLYDFNVFAYDELQLLRL